MTDSSDSPCASLPPRSSLEQLRKQAKDLLSAARSGRAEALSLLRHHLPGIDPSNAALHDAQTALARSYGFSGWSALKSRVDEVNITRIVQAVRRGDATAVRKLIRARPDLVNTEAPGFGEHRALHFAVLNRDVTLVRILMAAGANGHIGIYPHREATSALTIARERGYLEIVAIIEEHEQLRREALSCPNVTVSPEQDRLGDMIRQGNEAASRRMIEQDPSLLRACDHAGANPVHLAAGRMLPELVRWMLERHNAVRKTDLEGRTPMNCAAFEVEPTSLDRFREVAAILEFYGAALTPRAAVALGDEDRIRALFNADPAPFHGAVSPRKGGLIALATRLDRPDIVRLLLDLGLDPDERVRIPDIEEAVYSGGFPLWHAAGEGQYEIARILLTGGADAMAQVYASGDALSRAYNARDERMKDLLRSYGAAASPATIGLEGDVEAARELLAEIEERAERRSSDSGQDRSEIEELLWAAACGGFPEIVEMCLERINWASDDPRWYGMLDQPLRIWGHHPHRKFRDTDRSAYPACMKLMLDAGADPNVEGSFGRRLMHDIAGFGSVWGQPIMTEEERDTFARLLLDAGARLDVRDDLLRSTPLGWAVRWNRKGLVELLLEKGAPPDEPDAEDWASPFAWARKGGFKEIESLLMSRSGAIKQ